MTLLNLSSVLIVLAYYVLFASSIAALYLFLDISKEFARKLFHVAACGSVLIFVNLFNQWYQAVFSLLILTAIVFIVLPFLFQTTLMKKIPLARGGKNMEILKQAAFFFGTIILLITIIWGLFGEAYRYHIIVGVATLGLGDAAAALIGKKFGRKKIKGALVDSNKTFVGSFAMFTFSWIAIIISLIIFSDFNFVFILIASMVLAATAATVEAFSQQGFDTIFIPLVISFASLIMQQIEQWLNIL